MCVWEAGQLQELSDSDSAQLLGAAVDGDIAVVLLERVGRLPDWQRWIRGVLALPDYGSIPASLGAAIFCAIETGDGALRWVAWTFGSASRAFKRAATDPRYGLMSALNMISTPAVEEGQSESEEGKEAQLRNLQYRTTSPFIQQTGHRAARDTPLLGFRMDQQSDLLSAAGGRTSDSTFTEVFGGRSLRFRAEVNSLDDLTYLSRLVAKASAASAYKRDFAWVDNIVQVTDDQLIAELRKALVHELLSEANHPVVDVLLPDDLIDPQDPRTIEWVAYPRERLASASRKTLTAASVANLLQSVGDVEAALGIDLRFLDSGRNLLGSATVLDCLCADFRHGGQEYMAYDGDFYAVDPNFVHRVNEAVLRVEDWNYALPNYRGGSEATYNGQVGRARPTDILVLDTELLKFVGEYGIEACDLLHVSGAMVHVKRKGKSSKLSHLFFQATNSCRALHDSPDACRQLRLMAEKAAPAGELREGVLKALDSLGDGYRGQHVVFAILGDWRRRDATALPLLSKISLIQAVERLAALGFSPRLQLVPLERY